MTTEAAHDNLFSREQILSGLILRRSRNVLFAIENRCAYYAAYAGQNLNRFMTEEKASQIDTQFLESFSLGKETPNPASIQDIENYWQEWKSLLPESALMRAALVHHLGEKYTFNPASAPNLCRVLQVEDAETKAAFERLYQEPLASAFTWQMPVAERLRWLWARLSHWIENAPPFWAVYTITIVETIGAGILALPIALAGIGPIPGAVLLILLGLVNVLTIVFTAEYLARSGDLRYGHGFIGQIVRSYLGPKASFISSLGMILLYFLSVYVFYLGFSNSLAKITPISAPLWTLIFFVLSLFFIIRDTLSNTFIFSLLTGLLNIAVIVLLSILALGFFKPANLMHTNLPFINSNNTPFDPSILQLIFGVLMFSYFGHLSVIGCARMVIRRDPSSRSLTWGGVAATCTMIVLFVLWVLAVNSAVPAERLQQESGTALVPLAEYGGMAVLALGTIFVVSNMGLASIQYNAGLFDLVIEQIPARTHPQIILAQRRGRVILSDKNYPTYKTAVTYLGMQDDQVRLRIDLLQDGKPTSLEIGLKDHWAFPDDAAGVAFKKCTPWAIDLLDSNARAVRLHFETSLAVSYEGEWDNSGLNLAGVLELPPEVRKLIGWMARQENLGLAALSAHLQASENEARQILDMLVAEGMIVESIENDQLVFKPVFGHTRPSSLAGSLLKQGVKAPSGGWVYPAWQRLFFGKTGRSLLAFIPIFLVLFFAEKALMSGTDSFSEIISITSVITIPLLAGVFPILLLVASRRKGEFIPNRTYRFLENPILLAIIYVFNWAGLLVHAILWENPIQRVLALFTSLFLLVMSLVLWRRGVFTRRVVVRVEVQEQSQNETLVSLALISAGQELYAPLEWENRRGVKTHREISAVDLGPISELGKMHLRLPPQQAGELLVCVQRLNPEGRPLSQSGTVSINSPVVTQYDLYPTHGRILTPYPKNGCEIEIDLN